MEFHISRKARDAYHLSDSLFSVHGNVVFSNMRAVREFTASIHQVTGVGSAGMASITPGELFALGLLDEIFHVMIRKYREENNPQLYPKMTRAISRKTTQPTLHSTLVDFCQTFPPVEVYHTPDKASNYLAGSTDGMQNDHAALEEMILLWLTNRNPAAMKYEELFNENQLSLIEQYGLVLASIRKYLAGQPGFGPQGLDLISFLLKAIQVSPNSITGQLEYIRNNWGQYLGDIMSKLLSSLDLLQEEASFFRPAFTGPGPVEAPVYTDPGRGSYAEIEKFSPDQDWMPSVVMMAKNSYVWLYQLSRKYGRAITRLDEIPDEELDFLAGAGFTGLWLIGLWQRSKASERIKKLCGNPEAVASAYSIHSYQIADDLGGEAAFNNLRDRAWRRGIRMASDMVPNHFGIESDWVLYQPDKFLSLDYSPYPSYTFNGENLSPDPAIGIFLEDHYYSRTDAAVVFKRVDYHTGDTRYIYHGNDGTVMPWNDTAQLNYLRADVREAVIQIILDVARRTPIIRFDAAMTLAKKHIQRLWFPEPGSGGAIPSRAEHSLSRAEFDRLLPEEFWREVVDRVAREVPDTLLLAEAFWLMEGYFVRTLGMHRVYNSAFMHMLRNEDNANFRKLIKNTLEFDPEILKRYVNFMNNPDEKTAAEQFGDGDKYFGVCTVLATLPGLPMFGHGQLEGFSEKYGMEYRRAYMDEQVNEGLLNHHRKIIFPLIRQRAQFSGAAGFRLYDFYTQNGSVNDDVIAYTNEHFGRKSLVLFHNKYQNTAGWINISSPYLKKDNGATALQTESLASALGCSGLPGHYVIFREAATGLTYIRESQDIARSGWYAELSGYGHRVYQDFYEVADTKDAPYAELCRTLAGRGVPDLNRELRKIRIQDFYQTLAALLKPEVLRQVQAALITGGPAIEKLIQDNQSSLAKFSWHYHDLYPDNYSGREFSEVMNQSMIALADFQRFAQTLPGDSTGREIARQWNSLIAGDALPAIWLRVLAGSIHLTTKNQSAGLADYFDDWLLKSLLEDDPANLRKASWFFLTPELTRAASNSPAAYFAGAVGSAILPRELGFNLANNHLWFNQEAMQSWLELLPVTNYLALLTQPDLDANQKLEMIQQTVTLTRQLQAAFRQSDCMVEKMTRILNEPVTTQADKRSVP